MKKFLFGFFVFLLGSLPVSAGIFADIPEDHANYKAIKYLEENGVIDGYDDGTFRPEREVNRAEAAKIIAQAFGINVSGDYEAQFDDVPAEEWFFDFVMGSADVGVISGYADGTFKPANTVNLAETLKMMVLAAGVDLAEEVSEDVFVDVSSDLWYVPHALYARDHNIVMGDDAGLLNADKNMTRAAFSEVIYRMLIVLDNDGAAFPIQSNWPEYVSEYLPYKIKFDPQDWELREDEEDAVFVKANQALFQFSDARVYANSGLVRITVDENENNLSVTQYFETLREAFRGATFTEFQWQGFSAMEVLVPEERMVDWYIYLDDGSVLAAFTQYGEGVLGLKIQKLIKAMLQSLEYSELAIDEGPDYSALLSEIFAEVLVEGKGQALLDKVPDELIFETDTIGIGTGPVDYYYSEALDYTLKYERASDVILDTRPGQTSAF